MRKPKYSIGQKVFVEDTIDEVIPCTCIREIRRGEHTYRCTKCYGDGEVSRSKKIKVKGVVISVGMSIHDYDSGSACYEYRIARNRIDYATGHVRSGHTETYHHERELKPYK